MKIETFLDMLEERPSGCIDYIGKLTNSGYGSIRINGKSKGTHVASYEYHIGPVPKGICVLHTCDNKICCNPKHLFLGTRLDNVTDMWNKGRNAKVIGKKWGFSLTEDDVRNIRKQLAAGEIQIDIAERYKVSQVLISQIKLGKKWSHVQ